MILSKQGAKAEHSAARLYIHGARALSWNVTKGGELELYYWRGAGCPVSQNATDGGALES